MANAPYGAEFYTEKSIIARNTNTTQNINQISLTKIPIIGQIDTGYDPDYYTPDVGNGRIFCNFTGKLRVNCNLFIWSSNARQGIDIRIVVNGVARETHGGGSYIRDNSGHQTSMSSIYDEFDVTAGDYIEVWGERAGGSGSTYLDQVRDSILSLTKVLPNE